MRLRGWSKFLGGALALVLGAMLLATIYFTLFDLQWIAFLAGVLFAAVAALTSQTARAQLLVARRTRQLERNKAALAHACAARDAAETRFSSVADALPAVILFVDRDGRCGYHNRACEIWCGRGGDRIRNMPLQDVLADTIYQDLKTRSVDVLAGKAAHYAAAWPRGRDADEPSVALLPYPPETDRPEGFYLLVAKAPGAPPVQPTGSADSVGSVLAVPHESGETTYLQSMTEQLIRGGDPRGKLVRALEENQFLLFAQRIEPLSPKARHPQCMEVLLRLQEEEEHMLPPGGFFPIAERYNLLEEIDRWVVRNLLQWCATRRRADPLWHMPLYCVNICAATLGDPEFPRYVATELERAAMPGGNLCFEIAEPDLIDHFREVRALMRALKPLGCRFTADAFGSVKVSFVSFKHLQFDFVKIDGTIIQNILRERSDLAKVRAIALACGSLGVCTIAEFVESAETLARLREIGIDYAQGFGIATPGPINKAG